MVMDLCDTIITLSILLHITGTVCMLDDKFWEYVCTVIVHVSMYVQSTIQNLEKQFSIWFSGGSI